MLLMSVASFGGHNLGGIELFPPAEPLPVCPTRTARSSRPGHPRTACGVAAIGPMLIPGSQRRELIDGAGKLGLPRPTRDAAMRRLAAAAVDGSLGTATSPRG
jgi:hypothetical protein